MELKLRILALETSTRESSVALLQSTLDPTGLSELCQIELEKNVAGTLPYKPAGSGRANRPDHDALNANPEIRVDLVWEFLPIATESSSPKPGKSSSTSLISTIKRALDQAQWTAQAIDLIAVTVGPGSFTGLRIGVVTAKTLAYATSAHVVGVNTLQAIACQARDYLMKPSVRGCDPGTPFPRRICAAIDAQRGHVFSGRFPIECDLPENEDVVEMIVRDAWIDRLEADDMATGPALKRLQCNLSDRNFRFQFAPEDVWYPTAETVGRIAFGQFCLRGADDMWKLQPLYVRPSYADEPRRD